jgi:hypothetical protein
MSLARRPTVASVYKPQPEGQDRIANLISLKSLRWGASASASQQAAISGSVGQHDANVKEADAGR